MSHIYTNKQELSSYDINELLRYTDVSPRLEAAIYDMLDDLEEKTNQIEAYAKTLEDIEYFAMNAATAIDEFDGKQSKKYAKLLEELLKTLSEIESRATE